MFASNRSKSILNLHLIVLLWAGSGLVGHVVELSSEVISFYRMVIAAIALGFICVSHEKISLNLEPHTLQKSLIGGILLAFHWWCFFESIKQSTISIGLVCMSLSPFFISILQPLFSHTRIKASEILMGALCVIGIITIFGFEPQYKLGIIIGIGTALTEACHSILTGKIMSDDKNSAETTVFYQMAAGAIVLLVATALAENNLDFLSIDGYSNLLGLLFLGLICSAFAMVLYFRTLKHLTPFSAVLTINLEPIYGMLLTFVFFGESQSMSLGFYLGASLIVGCVFLDTFLKKSMKIEAHSH